MLWTALAAGGSYKRALAPRGYPRNPVHNMITAVETTDRVHKLAPGFKHFPPGLFVTLQNDAKTALVQRGSAAFDAFRKQIRGTTEFSNRLFHIDN